MTDRELLESAALASGHLVDDDLSTDKWLVIDPDPDTGEVTYWNPLENDGDAFRLSVKLRLHVDHHTDNVSVWAMSRNSASGIAERYEEFFGNNPCAATRRAIVRAAADIGKGMP